MQTGKGALLLTLYLTHVILADTQVVVNALIQAIPSILNVLLVCLVFWLIFSIMGVQLFGGRYFKCKDSEGETINATIIGRMEECLNASKLFNYTWENSKINFDNVGMAYLALFQVVRAEILYQRVL